MKNLLNIYRRLILLVLIGVISKTGVSFGLNNPETFYTPDEFNNITADLYDLDPISNRKIHMLVIFSKFKGEAPEYSLAPSWASRLFDGNPGSVTYYFDEISHGQMVVTGDYEEIMYELPEGEDYYVNNLEEYTRDLLRLVDKDKSIDFAKYDNDGPDGIPANEDDDGIVDYIVLMPISRPYNFITRNATGVARLGLQGSFYTNSLNYMNRTIKINWNSGSISRGSNFDEAVGNICHEYIHYFGVPDLYDRFYTSDETDSGGIGFWGIMGQGAVGWNYQGGPVAPSAYTRMLLGIIGENNANLEDIFGIHRNVRINDIGTAQGKVYRLWVSEREYFLIANRRNDSTYADRNLPNSGILIWHIYENSFGNYYEESKLCDLECADGKYRDAGFPKGKSPDTFKGGDNLDFWSHNSWYAETYGGNLGDATDVFDGLRYTSFGKYTNPNSNTKIVDQQTNIEITNIRRDGKDMIFDVSTTPFTEWDKEKYPLIGTAYQRHNNVFKYNEADIIETNTVYRIQYADNRLSDDIITVYKDSITVDIADSLNYLDVQHIIEKRLVSGNVRNTNSRISRKNLSMSEFTSELASTGISFSEIGSGTTPAWIQKISVSFEDSDRQQPIVLSQNYPNPFNTNTTIEYRTAEAGPVTLEVYNLAGQKVIAVDRGHEKAGHHTIALNFDGLSSGIYLYRIVGRSISETKKLLFIR